MSERVLAQIRRIVDGRPVLEGHFGVLETKQVNLDEGTDGRSIPLVANVFTGDEMKSQLLFFGNGATRRRTDAETWERVTREIRVVGYRRLDGSVGWKLK